MKTKLLLSLMLCICITFLQAQSEKIANEESMATLEEQASVPIDEQLLRYANILLKEDGNTSTKTTNAEGNSTLLYATYQDLLDNSLGEDQRKILYTHIINRVVKEDWRPELKAVALYSLMKNGILSDGKPAYTLHRNKVVNLVISDIYELVPALNPEKGNQLTEAEQFQLLIEGIEELKVKGISIDEYLTSFKVN